MTGVQTCALPIFQGPLGMSRYVMGVLVKIGVDEIDRLVLGIVVGLALFRCELGRHHLTAAIKRGGDDMCAFLQAETDKRLHHGHGAVKAVPQPLPALGRQAALVDPDMFPADSALEHLQRRI